MTNKQAHRHSHERIAFTLIEILVVAAIILVLAAMLFPVGASAIRAAKDAQCKNKLKALGTAYLTYASDHDGSVLTDGSSPNEWTRVLQPYFGYENFRSTLPPEWRCPAAPVRPGAQSWQPDYAGNVHGALYGFVNGDTSLGVVPSTTAGIKLPAQNHPSQVIAFLDWIPGWRFARVYEFGRVNNPSQDKDRVYRHNGKLNAVFVDGHVESITYPIPTVRSNAPWQ